MRYADLMRNMMNVKPVNEAGYKPIEAPQTETRPTYKPVEVSVQEEIQDTENREIKIPEPAMDRYPIKPERTTNHRRGRPKGYVGESLEILSSAWGSAKSYVSSFFKRKDYQDTKTAASDDAPETNLGELLAIEYVSEEPQFKEDVEIEISNAEATESAEIERYSITEDDINKLRLVIERVDDIYGMLQRGEKKGVEIEYIKKIGMGVGIIGKVLRRYSTEMEETKTSVSRTERSVARIEHSQKEILEGIEDVKRVSRDMLAVENLEIPEPTEKAVIVNEAGEVTFDQERMEKLFAVEALNTRRIILQAVEDVASRSRINYQRIGSMVYAAMQLYSGQRESKVIGGKQEKPQFKSDVEIDFETIGKQFLNDMGGVGEIRQELALLHEKLSSSEDERKETNKVLIQMGSLIKGLDVASGEKGKKLVSDVQGAVGGDVVKALKELDTGRSRAMGEIIRKFDGYMSDIRNGLDGLGGEIGRISERLTDLESRVGQKTPYSTGMIGDVRKEQKPTQRIPVKKGKADVWGMEEGRKLGTAVECVSLFPDLVPRRRTAEEFVEELKSDRNNVNYFLLEVEKKKGRDKLNSVTSD